MSFAKGYLCQVTADRKSTHDRGTRAQMDASNASASRPASQRRIIERSRLLQQLDASGFRTVLLVAPAGYGKTTLARQWSHRVGGAWLGLSAASADIPVLSRELSTALAEIASIDLSHVEAATRAARTPADQATNISKAILEHISEPVPSWLIIDDCHLLAPESPAEDLLAVLERSGFFRLMLASRVRPSWVHARRLLYGEVLELGANDLALDESEVSELLPPGQLTDAWRDQVRGWPAVIGLAAYLQMANAPPQDSLSKTLYDYFADEIYERASDVVQDHLARVALLPPLDPAELSDLMGQHDADAQVLSTGLVHQTEGQLEVHPLARAFLLGKVRDRDDTLELARASVAFALSRGCWDQAFGLIEEFEIDDLLTELITSSYSSLVETGRVTTLEMFGRRAAAYSNISQHILDLIEAEVAVRDGAFERALALGKSAAAGLAHNDPLKARCYFVAGSAAQFNHLLDDAFALHDHATKLAVRVQDINDATWGKCLAALYLEDERLRETTRELEAIVDPRPEDRLRVFIARQHLARLGDGLYDLRVEGATAAHLLALTTDPWVRSGWGNTYGYTLMLQAHYQEAREVLVAALRDVDTFGLTFGRPYIAWSLASVELGLRHFARADTLLRRVEQHAEENNNFHLQLNARVLRARLCLAQQRPKEALAVTSDDFETFPTKAMHGEYLATRSLVLAVIGDTANALTTANTANNLTGAVETRIMCAAVEAVAALGNSNASTAAYSLLQTAADLRTWDGVVCAARASPDLIARLASFPQYQSHLRQLLSRSNDSGLARTVGLGSSSYGPRTLLTRREREVIDLVRLGLKNHEIATTLFICDSTVKRHVLHIREKLGARTRAEAVARYAESD